MAADEYNKIHAMARGRKMVIQKFGSNLLNFWPMIAGSADLQRP